MVSAYEEDLQLNRESKPAIKKLNVSQKAEHLLKQVPIYRRAASSRASC